MLGFFLLLIIGVAESARSIQSGIANRTCEDGYLRVAGFIDYWWLAQCVIPKNDVVSILALVAWMLFLSYLLTSTQQYVSESVSRISSKITLSSRLFGVCFLSLSCIPNDQFVAIAGIYHGEQDMILAAILSSTSFMLTIGIAMILFYHKPDVHFKISRRPFLRDSFFLLLCGMIIGIFWHKKIITWWMSLILISIYVSYLVVVIGARLIFQQIRISQAHELGIIEDANEIFELGMSPDADEQAVMLLADMRGGIDLKLEVMRDEEETSVRCCHIEKAETQNHFRQFMGRLVWDGTEWNLKSIPMKIVFLLMLPIRILRNITIPAGVDAQWNKPIVLVNTFMSPLFILVATETIGLSFGSNSFQFPMWGLSLCISFLFALIIIFTSTMDKEPIYHVLLVACSLVMACMWVYFIGVEFVSTIAVFSSISKIPSVFGGIFVLGIANSIASILSLTTMAQEGLTTMALFTVWGLPPLKLMLCLGSSLLVGVITWGDLMFGDSTSFIALLVSFCFLPVILVYTLVTVASASFTPGRKVAIGFIILYLFYIVSIILLQWFLSSHRFV